MSAIIKVFTFSELLCYNISGDYMKCELPQKCLFVFDILEKNGFECYAVGGCVRDILLQRTPNDVDFTTNALPDEILACFKDYKTFELGKKYGTISVLHNDDIFEITTYRVDGEYSDSRHPDKIEFSRSLQDDLARRDFTINAMAVDKNGNVSDFFNGMNDLKRGVIRAVGDPFKRFNEDALRIFRALRFSAKLEFSIDSYTSDACHKLCGLLKKVHPQRIRDELSQLLITDSAALVIKEYSDVIAEIIPEFSSSFGFQQITPHHRYDVFSHIIKSVSFAPSDLEIRWALLLHDIGKPLCYTQDKAGISHFHSHPSVSADIAKEILTRFAYPSEFVERICLLIKYHDRRFERLRPQIKKILAKLGSEGFLKLLIIQRCDAMAQSEYMREDKLNHIKMVYDEAQRIIEENDCICLGDLAVNGTDILSLGIKGKAVGEVLDYLLEGVIDDRFMNNKEELIKAAVQFTSHIDK